MFLRETVSELTVYSTVQQYSTVYSTVHLVVRGGKSVQTCHFSFYLCTRLLSTDSLARNTEQPPREESGI